MHVEHGSTACSKEEHYLLERFRLMACGAIGCFAMSSQPWHTPQSRAKTRSLPLLHPMWRFIKDMWGLINILCP